MTFLRNHIPFRHGASVLKPAASGPGASVPTHPNTCKIYSMNLLMKRMICGLILLLAFFQTQNLSGQTEDPVLPFASDKVWDEANEYTDPNKGEFFNYSYDPCTGILKYVFFVYETGETDEVQRMTLRLRTEDGTEEVQMFDFYLLTSAHTHEIELPTFLSSTTASYEADANLTSAKVRTRGEDVFIQIDYLVGTRFQFQKNFINMNVTILGSDGFNEVTSSSIFNNNKSSFTANALQPPSSAPNVSRLADAKGFKIDFLLPTNCTGTYTDDDGPFYEVQRAEADGSGLTTIIEDIAYSIGSKQHNDVSSGANFIDDCTEYKYRVRVYSRVGGVKQYAGESESDFSTALKYVELLDEPSNISATTDLCDGTISLTWDYNFANPDAFYVYRKMPEDSEFSLLSEVSGGVRNFSDPIGEDDRNKDIQYRVATYNGCDATPAASLTTVTGKAIEALVAPTDVKVEELVNGNSKGVRITWNDNSDVEDNYIISRQLKNGGGLVNIELSANATSYDDFDVSVCELYVYTVKVVNDSCAPDGFSEPDETQEISLDAELSNIITESSLIASRGYFSDRVTLDWTVGGISDNISRYRIFSRPLGSTGEPVAIGVVSGTERSYEDTKAEPGLVLEYFLIGETDCGEALLTTNDTDQIALSTTGVSKATGFRSPTGVINGNIAYEGGNGVGGVKVIVETDQGNNGRSLLFDGNDAVTINDSDKSLTPESMSLGFYLRPELNDLADEGATLFEKSNAYRVTLAKDGKLTFALFIDGAYQSVESTDALSGTTFQQLYLTYDGTSMKIYIDGELDNTKAQSGSMDLDNAQALVIGSVYHGLLDEISLWDIAKSANSIVTDYVRLLNRDEEGLIGYWPIGVGLGEEAFDASMTGNKFNGNDGLLVGVEWSEVIPDRDQLGTVAYTNSQGNYTVDGIAFNGEGQNFTVTPVFGVHEFSPQQRFIYLGQGNLVQNAVDFEDISSFTVTGSVVFDFNETKVGSEDVKLLVDGRPVFDANGKVILTDENGLFSIQVPIGEHSISVEKDDHTFAFEGRFPSDPEDFHNFNEPISGLEFVDETRRKLVGKVVGGTREGNKPVGFEKTLNNIGKAKFKLVSTDKKIDLEIETDEVTGEYMVDLPPRIYQVVDPVTEDIGKIRLVSTNTTITAPTLEIDLFTEFEPSSDRDTVVIADEVPLLPGVVRIDTVDNNTREVREFSYDKKVNQVHRTTPRVIVGDGRFTAAKTKFLGDKTAEVPNGDEDPVMLNLINEAFIGDEAATDEQLFTLGFPLVKSEHDYKLIVNVNELYINNDSGSPVEDVVPVTDALITIDNDMMRPFYLDNNGVPTNYSDEPELTKIVLNSQDGDTLVHFKALDPEFNENSSNPALSYTREFKLTVNAGGNIVNWPNPNDPNAVQHVYVLGDQKTENSSFVTSGPSVVEFIIRDPYGGESFAFLEKGETITMSQEYNLVESSAAGVDLTVRLGSDDGDKTSVKLNAGFESESSKDSTGTFTTELTTTQRIETRSDAEEVGTGGDLYVSRSNNYQAGLSRRLRLVDIGNCSEDGLITCFDDSPVIEKDGKSYKLGRSFATFLEPDSIPTYFIFTQNHIIKTLIPDLQNARNSILAFSDKYVSKLLPTDANYGLSNDDPVWNLDPEINNPDLYDHEEDSDGNSYTFTREKDSDVDSVAWLNQQIRLWREAIERNEVEKLVALGGDPDDNISVSAGARFAKEITSSETTETSVTYGLSSSFSAGLEVNVGNAFFGINTQANLDITESTSLGTVGSETNSTTYGYEIYEPDVGDFVSMNVYDGLNNNGPVFILTGGETSCPHEEAPVTMFAQPGTQIGSSTFQRDKPRLEVDVAELFNVPADAQASFNVTLFNDSESQDDFFYTLQVIDQSNPNGAVLKIDGEFFDSRRQFLVPGTGAINKVITVERGPFDYDYEDIKVVMGSVCQSDPTDFERVIADTVSISAFFLPVCTTPEIVSPDDNWTVNNRFMNQMSIEIGEFDINFSGFEFLELQYKSAESSTWIPIQRFFRDLEASGNPANGMEIPRTGSSFSYQWDVSAIQDGDYDIRVISDCEVLATNGRVTADSRIKSGTIDRINPHAFGSPQPGDGILSPGDEISIQFNEPINTAIVPQNFIMTGVLNGADLDHNISVHFDGTGNGEVTMTNPPNLRRKTFTIDFWAKRAGTGAAVMLHQGASETEMLQLGFNASDQVYFNINGQVFQTAIAVTNEQWNHYSFVYDHEAKEARVWVASGTDTFQEAKPDFAADYQVQETMVLGKSTLENPMPFNGFLHELRIWNRTFTESEITTNRSVVLSPGTVGLLANWTFEEGRGEFVSDKVKSRQAAVNTSWRIDPAGMSMSLNGTTAYLEADGVAHFDADQDFTLELWFKTDSEEAMNFFSSGRGDGTDDNAAGWSLGIEAGNVFLETNGKTIRKSGLNLADGQWHHIAMVVDRLTNTTLLVDGESRGFLNSDVLGEFSGDTFWFGRRGWKENGVQKSDQYFEGQLDEIRLWSTARRLREISFSRYNKLKGDELGLRLYYPFESFQLSPAQIYLSEEDLTNNANGEDAVAATLDNQNGAFADDTPPIRLPRPLQSVNFNYSVNGDKIILTPNEDNDRIENVELSIGVKNIKDLNGNGLDAPITWTAFVDRNDVVWLDDELNLEKELNAAYAFEVEITNQGGQLRDFVISNLPAWLTASPSSGTLEPTRSRTIRFEVDEGLNIGEYDEFVHLTTDFGFDERLSLNLNVFKAPPVDWTVEPSDYQFSMSLVGAVKISDILSRDKNDLIAAFIDGEVRGVAPLSYVSEFDQYQAFLSIYTNDDVGKDITYKVWDASEGLVYTGIRLSNQSAGKVSQDAFFGTPAAPVVLMADTFLENTVEVGAGWNWISFNLNSDDLADINTLMSDFPATENDQLKGTEFFDQYDPVNGWIGSLSANGGVQKERMYKLNSVNGGEITFTGSLIDVASAPVNLSEGWNWVGFLGRNNQSIDEALSNITNLSVGDRIKGQREFAIYGGAGIGWVGSLSSLKPGEGYLYYAGTAGVLTYPELSVGISSTSSGQSLISSSGSIDFEQYGLNPTQFETNMNMVVEVSGIELQPDDLLLIRNAEDEVVGLAYASDNPVLDEPAFFVTIYGNSASSIEFELLRGSRTFTLTPQRQVTFTYQADTHSGSLEAPVILLAEEISAESITAKAIPNPFENNVRVSWLAADPPEHIQIVNTDGLVMQNLSELKGGHQDISFEGMGQGMYLIRLHFEQKTLVLKVIKSK